jgi:hypothetical protein
VAAAWQRLLQGGCGRRARCVACAHQEDPRALFRRPARKNIDSDRSITLQRRALMHQLHSIDFAIGRDGAVI